MCPNVIQSPSFLIETKCVYCEVGNVFFKYRVIQKDGLNHVVGRSFSFTQTAYLLKLMIPTTNVETKTKLTLHSSRRLSFNELKNAKHLVLHSSHFVLN